MYWYLSPIANCQLVPIALLPIACCLLPIAHCLLPIAYCLLPIAYCLLPIAYCLLPFAYCLLPIAYCLLPIAYCLLPIACCLLPVACCLLSNKATRKENANVNCFCNSAAKCSLNVRSHFGSSHFGLSLWSDSIRRTLSAFLPGLLQWQWKWWPQLPSSGMTERQWRLSCKHSLSSCIPCHNTC